MAGADHQGHVAGVGFARDQLVQAGQQADSADGGGGQDGLAIGFVIKRDVARDDRHVQRGDGGPDAFDGADELAHDLWLFGLAEVQVVGAGQRQGAHGGQVAIGFGHCLLATFERVGLDIAGRHVAGKGQRLAGSMHAHHASRQARSDQRVGADLAVILFPDPALVRIAGRGDQRLERIHRVSLGDRAKRSGRRGFHPGPVIFRRAGRQFGQRQVGFYLVAVQDQEAILGDGFAHDGEIQIPFDKDRPRFGLFFRLQHHEHPLLAFGQHHLIGVHAAFALGHVVQLQLDAQPALVAHLHRRTGQPSGAHVLNRDHGARGHQLQAGLQQTLFGERVADLNGGALFLDRVVEFGGCHGGAADAIAACLGAKVDDGHTHAAGLGIEDLVGIGQTGGKGIDQAVAVIGRMKAHFAADGGHAKRVAIAADAFDHALDQMRGLGVAGQAEGQRVHRGNRAGAHGEHVAQDATHAGGRALMRFDVAGVVVAFHLEDDRLAIANIYHARIFARTADHLRPGGGQGAQPAFGRLVGTMLVPHGRKDAKFGECRLATDDAQQPVPFVRLDPVGGHQVGCDLGFGHGSNSHKRRCRASYGTRGQRGSIRSMAWARDRDFSCSRGADFAADRGVGQCLRPNLEQSGASSKKRPSFRSAEVQQGGKGQ